MIIETVCVNKLTITDSDNGQSPDRRQAIIWTNAVILFIRTLGTNLREIWSETQTFSFKIMNLKMPSSKWQKICLGLNLLLHTISWWRHQMETCSALLALCVGNSPIIGEFPSQSQWRGALMFSLICAWINGWVNNRKAGDLRRAHYDVTVMGCDFGFFVVMLIVLIYLYITHICRLLQKHWG